MELDADLHIIPTLNIEIQEALVDGEFDNGNVWNDLGLQMGAASVYVQHVEKTESESDNKMVFMGAAAVAALLILITVFLVHKKV